MNPETNELIHLLEENRGRLIVDYDNDLQGFRAKFLDILFMGDHKKYERISANTLNCFLLEEELPYFIIERASCSGDTPWDRYWLIIKSENDDIFLDDI